MQIGMQSQAFQIRYENRFPIQQMREDGTWGCRGCGGVIPKGRQTWCSSQCSDTYHPGTVIFKAKQRDKEVCSMCGYDRPKAYREWWTERAEVEKLYRSHWTPDFKPGDTYPDNSEYHRRFKEWSSKHKPLKIEYDHIIPFSEGGLTVLENIRSLCSVCHKERTAQWRKTRSNKQPAMNELAFA